MASREFASQAEAAAMGGRRTAFSKTTAISR